MIQSSLEVLTVLCKQIRFFMCRDAFFAQKICVEGVLKIPCLTLVFCLLWFSRDMTLREVLTLWSSGSSQAESDNELAFESIYTL